ncbi:LacI family DNA-binding transcriptional regulator [Microbacterium awajiense]|uniref:LacI family DNA-binding transcriptional regulator n=1 Tax=Microbacterium awajiense TaxID=415214 RepID=A0ABP6ZZA9_9MICO
MAEEPAAMVRPRATVREVADRTGLSIATVSRVLNGNARVAAPTRERVLEALIDLGSAAPFARAGLRAGDAPIFVRCPYELTDYFGLIVTAVAEELAARDRPMVLDAGESSQQRHPLGNLPLRVDCAGAILILPPEDTSELTQLRRHGFPFVIVDPRTPPPTDSVVVSAAHLRGAQRLTEHLLELGHRRIGLLAGPDEWLASRERLSGHVAALGQAGMLQDPQLTQSIRPTIDEGRAAASRLLSQPEPPTALVCFNDKVAVGALLSAQDAGLSVPEDLSIVGFDDSEISRVTRPDITTVRQPLGELGRAGVAHLMRLIDGAPIDEVRVELSTRLIIRGSSGPPPA